MGMEGAFPTQGILDPSLGSLGMTQAGAGMGSSTHLCPGGSEKRQSGEKKPLLGDLGK